MISNGLPESSEAASLCYMLIGRHLDVLIQKRAEISPVLIKYSPDGSAVSDQTASE
jgi:hypothetical protein